jgi:opacity protein-like surface antigen
MMRSIVLLPAAFVLVWAAPASAQTDYSRDGFIVGVAGTYAIDTFENDLEKTIQDEAGGLAGLRVSDTLGINANVGYRFHPYVSAEIEAEWLDGFDSDITIAGEGAVARASVEPWVITANAKGYPLTERYQPFALVGLGVMTAKLKARDTFQSGGSESARFTDFAMRFGNS